MKQRKQKNPKAKGMVKIDSSKANFVCPRCQRIYYQVDKAEFDESPAKYAREAHEYKRYYHSCKKGGKR